MFLAYRFCFCIQLPTSHFRLHDTKTLGSASHVPRCAFLFRISFKSLARAIFYRLSLTWYCFCYLQEVAEAPLAVVAVDAAKWSDEDAIAKRTTTWTTEEEDEGYEENDEEDDEDNDDDDDDEDPTLDDHGGGRRRRRR